MSFRARLTVLAAAAIAVTVAAASLALWLVAKHELRGQVDDALKTRAFQVRFGHRGPFGGGFGDPTTAVQIIGPDGSVLSDGGVPQPLTDRVKAVAAGERNGFFMDATVQRTHARVLVVPIEGGAAELARSLHETDHALHRIGVAIFIVGAGGVGIAAAIAAFVAAAALRPVRRLTQAAEGVAATGDLGARVAVRGSDELARLGTRFNEMLAALESSVGAQRQLVADASHELRTPLTALRTNLELLQEGRLPPSEATRALDEAGAELEELTRLVADLVELARGQERRLRVEEVRLDEIAAAVVERARTRAPALVFATRLSPSLVRGDPELLERAIANLVDNAVKWSPTHGQIEIEVAGAEVTVRDHGPGIAEADLPHVFDRFYRSKAARAKPGSGLGLAIVREAAEAHGGRASVESSSTGARFRLTLSPSS